MRWAGASADARVPLPARLGHDMERVLILLAVVAATAVLAWLHRRVDGRVVVTASGSFPDVAPAAGSPTAAVGHHPHPLADAALTLMAFTAPNCPPCLPTRAVLDEIVADRRDVVVATVDVSTADPALLRDLRVMRAPTTLLLGPGGLVLGRVSGVPRRGDLAALVDRSAAALVAAPHG